MVRPCKECEKDKLPGDCECRDWRKWFPESWFHVCAWIRRELAWKEERCRAKKRPEPKPSPDGRYTHREIVFGTVFTELWR